MDSKKGEKLPRPFPGMGETLSYPDDVIIINLKL